MQTTADDGNKDPMDVDQAGSNQSDVALTSSDGQTVRMPRQLAEMALTIKHMLEDLGDDADPDASIPLPNITARTLEQLIAFLQISGPQYSLALNSAPESDPIVGAASSSKHAMDAIYNSAWFQEFFAPFRANPTDDLFAFILGANFLDIKAALDASTYVVSQIIKGKTPEQIRQLLNIKNDFTPEEEEEIRKENEWCEER